MSKINSLSKKNIGFGLAILVLMVGFYPGLSWAQSVSDLQRQIDSIDSDINESQSRVEQLRKEGDTLENRLKIINTEARQTQAEIDKTEKEIASTRSDIEQKEAELQRTKELIQANVKVLYKHGTPTTLEMLFSSENFTDFINRQEYLDRVKDSLNEAARESVAIKLELEEKEEELNAKSVELDSQKRRLAARQQEQRVLVEQTRGEEARYQDLVSTQEKKREQLMQEQAAAMAAAAAARRSSGPSFAGSSEYPWPNASMKYNDYCIYSDGTSGADPWGYCKRQCTSYVAWMLERDGRVGFSYLGHASGWKAGGTPVTFQRAQRGDVLVWDIGGYGHVMYVESRTSAGLNISQFNTPFGSGTYSTDFFSWSELNEGVGGAGFAVRRF